MNPILAALLPSPPQAGTSVSSASTPSTPTLPPSPADAGSAAQFKLQFDQAVAALANAAGTGTQGTTATTTTVQAGGASTVISLADALQQALQKKIADMLANGDTVSEIVQQLAASLATTLAQQFGGDPAQIQNQLQTAFASALSPPTTTGPPLSNADLASALAQQFRQVADVAAGVIGETGQSNRLFAGSISDAATTAGVQPAPQPTGNDPAPADSIATDASALLASLTASQGDGKTVATNGAPALGSNGDTLLGRILARATLSQPMPTGSQAPDALAPGPGTSRLTTLALAAATAALGNLAATVSAPVPAPVATLPAAAITSVIADAAPAPATNSGSVRGGRDRSAGAAQSGRCGLRQGVLRRARIDGHAAGPPRPQPATTRERSFRPPTCPRKPRRSAPSRPSKRRCRTMRHRLTVRTPQPRPRSRRRRRWTPIWSSIKSSTACLSTRLTPRRSCGCDSFRKNSATSASSSRSKAARFPRKLWRRPRPLTTRLSPDKDSSRARSRTPA